MHATLFTKARNSLLIFGCIYAVALLSLLIPAVQTNIFYLHRVRYPFFVDLERPETFGFGANRARSVRLDRDLHAWYIEPLSTISASQRDSGNLELIVYFHGTVGNVATRHRLTTYRLLSAGPNTHVLAFDYRGFGLSPGTPDEQGLIDDGVSAVRWGLKHGFRAEQIVLFGQSLGSAVAIGTAHQLAMRDGIKIKRIVSVAGFSSAKEVAVSYRVGGIMPIIGPLRTYPVLQKWLLSYLIPAWNSSGRVFDLAQHTEIAMTFAHAETDTEIPYQHSESLFRSAHRGRMAKTGTSSDDHSSLVKQSEGMYGGLEMKSGDTIQYLQLQWGSHNQVQWNDALLKLIYR